MNQAGIEPQAMVQSKHQLSRPLSAIQRYGLALLSVSLALGAGRRLNRYNFHNVADPLFLFAIAITVWYAGPVACNSRPGSIGLGRLLLLHRADLQYLHCLLVGCEARPP